MSNDAALEGEMSAEELLLNAQFTETETDGNVEAEELSEDEIALQEEASKMGWVPKDEYEGNNVWVDAGEFIRRQELFDKIRSQNKRYEKLEAQLANITKTVKKWSESEYLTQLAAAKAERDAAMDNEDRDAADAANEKITELKVAKARADSQDSEDDSDGDDGGNKDKQAHAQEVADAWLVENPWFKESPELKEMADDYAKLFGSAATKDTPIEELFEFVDKKMKRHVALWEKENAAGDEDEDEEEEVEDKKGVKMSKVATASRAARGTKRAPKFSRRDLDETQLSTLVNWILPNKIMTEEQYIQSLVDEGDLRK